MCSQAVYLGVTGWVHTNRGSSLLCRWPEDDNVGVVRTKRDSIHIPATMACLALVTESYHLAHSLFICGTWSRSIVPDHNFLLINPGAAGRLSCILQQNVAVQSQVAFSFISTDSASAPGKATAHSPVKTCTPQRYTAGLCRWNPCICLHLSYKSSQKDHCKLYFWPCNVTLRWTSEEPLVQTGI